MRLTNATFLLPNATFNLVNATFLPNATFLLPNATFLLPNATFLLSNRPKRFTLKSFKTLYFVCRDLTLTAYKSAEVAQRLGESVFQVNYFMVFLITYDELLRKTILTRIFAIGKSEKMFCKIF